MNKLGIDIDDVIFKTSEELLKVLENCDDEEILEHKLDIMRGDAVNEKVGNFLFYRCIDMQDFYKSIGKKKDDR